VTVHPRRRLYVINRCQRLKVLDFRKVKQKVRRAPAPAAPRRRMPGRALPAGPQAMSLAASLPALHSGLLNRCVRMRPSPCSAQERDEAARLFGADAAAAAANGEKTFEPGEGMAEAEPPEAEPAAEPVVEEPSARKGPTQEQLTAIKARPGGEWPPSRLAWRRGSIRERWQARLGLLVDRGPLFSTCTEGAAARMAHRPLQMPAQRVNVHLPDLVQAVTAAPASTCEQGAAAPQRSHLPVAAAAQHPISKRRPRPARPSPRRPSGGRRRPSPTRPRWRRSRGWSPRCAPGPCPARRPPRRPRPTARRAAAAARRPWTRGDPRAGAPHRRRRAGCWECCPARRGGRAARRLPGGSASGSHGRGRSCGTAAGPLVSCGSRSTCPSRDALSGSMGAARLRRVRLEAAGLLRSLPGRSSAARNAAGGRRAARRQSSCGRRGNAGAAAMLMWALPACVCCREAAAAAGYSPVSACARARGHAVLPAAGLCGGGARPALPRHGGAANLEPQQLPGIEAAALVLSV